MVIADRGNDNCRYHRANTRNFDQAAAASICFGLVLQDLIELRDALVCAANFVDQYPQQWSDRCRQPVVIFACNDSEQLIEATSLGCRDNPVLSHVPAHSIDRASPLTDQMITHAMLRQCGLLLDGLDADEAHARPLHSFAARFGFGSVVLVVLT